MFTDHPETLRSLVRQRHQQLAHEANQTRLRNQFRRRSRET